MYSTGASTEADGSPDFCLEVLPLRLGRECREDFLARLGGASSGLLFLTAHSISMILFFRFSSVNRSTQTTGPVAYTPIMEFLVVWNVRPRFSVEFQRYFQTTPVGKVR